MSIFAASKDKKEMPAHKKTVCNTLSELLSEYDVLKQKGKDFVVEGNRIKMNGRTVIELDIPLQDNNLYDFLNEIPKETIDCIEKIAQKECITKSELIVRLVDAEKAKSQINKTTIISERKELCEYLLDVRKKSGMKVPSVAEIAGLKQSAVRIIEKGDVNFSCTSALKYLSCFSMCFAILCENGSDLKLFRNDDIIDWMIEINQSKGSVESFATALGNDPKTLYSIFDKRSNVSIDMLIKSANHLGLKLVVTAA